MSFFSKKIKKINYSFVMGRFSQKIGDHFQYFPIETWQDELKIGRKFGFDGVEWIISDYSNPIFNYKGISNIQKELKLSKSNNNYLSDMKYNIKKFNEVF